MKKLLIALVLLCVLPAQAAVQSIQVTIGASATQVSATAFYCTWVSFQNNAAHTIRLGDSTVTSSKGIQVFANGSFFVPPLAQSAQATNLASWYISGTQNDVIDVTCEKVGP